MEATQIERGAYALHALVLRPASAYHSFERPIVVDSGQSSLVKLSTESKPKTTIDPRYNRRIFLAFMVIATIGAIVWPKNNAPLNQTTEVNANSTPVSLKESDEQIRADNDAVLDALQKRSFISSSAPGSPAPVQPKESDEQIRAENNKILDALRKTKHHRAG
jgi:hypothetical protein